MYPPEQRCQGSQQSQTLPKASLLAGIEQSPHVKESWGGQSCLASMAQAAPCLLHDLGGQVGMVQVAVGLLLV